MQPSLIDMTNGNDEETLQPGQADLSNKSPGPQLDAPTLAFQRNEVSSVTNPVDEKKQLRLFGDYEIESEIARGGMGVVYRARQLSLNRPVALKMILAGQLASEDDVRRFYLEAEAAAKLEHPNIVPIYEIGEIGGQHFFSMGYVEGGSLDRLLNEGPLREEIAVSIMIQVADAIQYAHDRSIIHRDLKPANILLSASHHTSRGVSTVRPNSTQTKPSLEQSNASAKGKSSSPSTASSISKSTSTQEPVDEWTPKVSDFGLAKHLESKSDLTGTGQILGTPSYMPPEQANADPSKIGEASDVYSLGAILYRALGGRPPFQAATAMETILQVLSQEPVSLRQLNQSIPIDLDTICLKCLNKDPQRRYASASDFRDDLICWQQGLPISARPISRTERALRWLKRNPAYGITASVVAACLLIVMGILFSTNRSLKAERDDAIQARNEASVQRGIAQTRLKKALEAVDKMMVRVASQRWAKTPELQSERREVLEDAVKFYATLAESSSDSPLVRSEAIKALHQVAAVKYVLNDFNGALEACDRAIEDCDSLMKQEENLANYLSEKSTLQSIRANIYALSDKVEKSIEELEAARQNAQRAIELQPDNRFFAMRGLELDNYFAYFALASNSSELKSSVKKTLPEVVERARKLVQRPAPTMEEQLTLAFSLTVQSAFLLTDGKFVEAGNGYNECKSILAQIENETASDPRHADQLLHVRAIAFVNSGLCMSMSSQSDLKHAIESVETGIVQLNDLIRMHPQAMVYQLQLLQAYGTKAAIFRRQNQLEEAERADKEVMALTLKMIQEFPEQPWLRMFDVGRASIALVERVRQGDTSQLDKLCEELLAATTPKSRDSISYNVACVYSVATLQQTDESPRFREKALAILRSLAAKGYFTGLQLEHAKEDEDLKPIAPCIDWDQLRFDVPAN